MPLISIKDAAAWDAFVASQPRAQFTQSWAWGEFRISRGQAIERLALVNENGAWDAAALFIHFPKPLVGGYWYAPRGPIVRDALIESGKANDIVQGFMDSLTSHGLPRRAMFWRIEPAITTTPDTRHPTQSIRSHAYMPASTSLLDLSRPESDLLAAMHEKARYNIRVAERHGVTVRDASQPEDIETFLALNAETETRDRFLSQPSNYIRDTYAHLSAQGMARLRFAEKNGEALAASFEIIFGDTVTYLYGASSSKSRSAMAPYALHWSAIRAAQAEGYRYYDFYGVNPTDTNSSYYKKTWEGITRFKLGWGGERVDYAGTWELPRMKMLHRLFRLFSN